MAIECEAKIRIEDLTAIQYRLRQLGAALGGECLERNWVLDDKNNSLRDRDVLLRVRNMGDVGGILTVKRKAGGGAFKTREEIESMIDSTSDLLRQLELIGFHIRWIYEKKRQTWLYNECVVSLDALPEIGSYVEIEGAPDAISAVIRELGLDPADHIDDNYLGLWTKYLKSRGESPRHMIFAHPEKESREDKA